MPPEILMAIPLIIAYLFLRTILKYLLLSFQPYHLKHLKFQRDYVIAFSLLGIPLAVHWILTEEQTERYQSDLLDIINGIKKPSDIFPLMDNVTEKEALRTIELSVKTHLKRKEHGH